VKLACMHCGADDGHTNGGALFCWPCTDELSSEAKDAAIDAYLQRAVLREWAEKRAA